MTEAELQADVANLCAKLGLYHYHNPDSRQSESGWPDSVILNLSTGAMIFRELKTAGAELSSDQKRIRYALVAGGHDWEVWRPSDLASGRIGATLAELAG